MSNKIDKSLILNTLKLHYGFNSDSDFARYLGVKPQTLSSWHSRNTFDVDLIYSKCVNIDANFLLSGEGEIEKTKCKENSNKENVTNNVTENVTKPNVNKIVTNKDSSKEGSFVLTLSDIDSLIQKKLETIFDITKIVQNISDKQTDHIKSEMQIIYDEVTNVRVNQAAFNELARVYLEDMIEWKDEQVQLQDKEDKKERKKEGKN